MALYAYATFKVSYTRLVRDPANMVGYVTLIKLDVLFGEMLCYLEVTLYFLPYFIKH